MNDGNLQLFASFIRARQDVKEARQRGASPPWTGDPILKKYRFCNIQREDDRTTAWIRENLRKPMEGSPLLITAMVAARLINRIETLELMAHGWLYAGWNERRDVDIMRQLADSGRPITNSAYMVTTPEGMDKASGISFMVSAAQCDVGLQTLKWHSLRELHARLMLLPRIGSFLAGQVVADVKYDPAMAGIADWHSFAASGPGSRRGLNRIMGRHVSSPWEEEEWFERHSELRRKLLPLLRKLSLPDLHAQDINNCECEYDKYERVRLREGAPKQLFTPHQLEEKTMQLL